MNTWDRVPSLIKFKTGTAILKDYYLKHKFLNEQDLDELVNRSHMGYEQVREWFAERQRRSELGIELFEENEEEEEVVDQEEDEEETIQWNSTYCTSDHNCHSYTHFHWE